MRVQQSSFEPPGKKVNWETAKSCLAELNREASDILTQGVLIGGLACWFYRQLLDKAQDADFKVPIFSESQEKLWLSKDIDFTNFFIQDARDLLSKYVFKDPEGITRIKLAGISVGFAQVGVNFDPELAWTDSWIGSFKWDDSNIQFRVLDPITLYREKLALCQGRGAESDHIHCKLLAEYLRYETCKQVRILSEAKLLQERTEPLKFLINVRDRAPETCFDPRVQQRIAATVKTATLTPSENKLIKELLEFGEPTQTSEL